jgi:MATE family multidrug resistance protein
MLDYDADKALASRQLFMDEDDEVSYNNYVENTIDPGSTLFVIAVIISLFSIVSVPLVAKLGRYTVGKYRRRDNSGGGGDDFEISHIEQDGALVASPVVEHEQSQTDAPESPSSSQRCRKAMYPDVQSTGRLETAEEVDASVRFDRIEARGHDEHGNHGRDVGEMPPLRDGSEKMGDRRLGDSPERSAIPLTKVKASLGFLNEMFCYCWTVVKYDREMKRILRLSIPFTISAISKTASELIIVAIISHTLGTNAMVAYAMTYGLVGITFSFMGGWHEAVTTLVSMAHGAENHELAGKYVQVACISYILCEIPMAFIWIATMSKILLLLGFDDSVAMLGQDFVWIRVLINTMAGVNLCFLNFLAAIEHDKFSNIMFTAESIAKAGSVALAAYQLDASLIVLGLVLLVNATLVFSLIVLIPIKMEWLRIFEKGLFSSCARTDMSVMKDVIRVALPLAFGALMAYAEWEMLTIFAATLGPAEVATWTVMGFVWDLFESTTEAAGDASEIRVSYHLGKGRPSMAKLAGFKSMLFGAILSILVSIIFISLTDILPSLLTRDATIQYMLAELFPLVALGNITMSMGMVCWTIIGAQGRYHLSTLIALTCSFVVTIPIGAVVTIWLRIDLQGLAFAVVTGYTVTATLLSACIIMSDWEMLSKTIQDQVCADDLSDSSDDDSSTSSSSSHEEKVRNSQTPEVFRQNNVSLELPTTSH